MFPFGGGGLPTSPPTMTQEEEEKVNKARKDNPDCQFFSQSFTNSSNINGKKTTNESFKYMMACRGKEPEVIVARGANLDEGQISAQFKGDIFGRSDIFGHMKDLEDSLFTFKEINRPKIDAIPPPTAEAEPKRGVEPKRAPKADRR